MKKIDDKISEKVTSLVTEYICSSFEVLKNNELWKKAIKKACEATEGVDDSFADYIIKYKPNHIVGVPTHYTSLMKDKRMEKVNFSKFLKSISAGGDYFLEGNEQEFNEFLHNHGYDKNVIVGFGLTECNSSVSTRLNKCNVVGSAGVPLAKNTISIFALPKDDNVEYTDKELKYGEYGEICITGPTQMLGYYKDKEKTYMKCYPAAKQEDSYEFPAGVNGGGLCFTNCRYLKKVVYAKDSIMGQDFYECHNLTVVLPDVVVNPATGSESDSYDGKWEPFKNCTNFILQGKKNPFMQACAVSKGFTYSIV